ncbi:MAG: proline--tRNA ligase, partial [Thermomicrobiales bacterium]|nr:proline--tRNA ligase [Thermomicrobiales bacterium]
EMERIDCHELAMPVVHPADLWQETGRWYDIGDELVRFVDRAERPMVLAMTHEEVATDLVRREVRSYRQLPVQFFQIQTKYRDEPRPRAGLLRGREFLMKDAYSFHTNRNDLQRFYEDCHHAYLRAFARCGIDVVVVESDSGIMGGEGSHEYMLIADAGEDVLLTCPSCGYAANREVARTSLPAPDDAPLPMEEVETPGATTIEAVATYLDVGRDRTAKAVFYEADGKLIFVVIRGDRSVNEIKLAELLGAPQVAPAGEELIRGSGAVPGYASPVGLTDTIVVADETARAPNLVAGANRDGYHLINVNLGRDYEPTHLADILMVEAGDPCPECGAALVEQRGIEVGNIFKLGTTYSAPLKAVYLDENDNEQIMVMGSYGFGVSRMLAALAEHHHDDRGLRWPASVAPFEVHLVLIGANDEAREAADGVYRMLQAEGIEVLYDDRDESAGVKFADADLIGIPIRLTVSNRSLKSGGVELKLRNQPPADAEVVAVESVVAQVRSHLTTMFAALQPR